MRKFKIRMIGASIEGDKVCGREATALVSAEKTSDAVFAMLRKFEEKNGDNIPIDFISVDEITT